jgi:hypothetical protein
MRDVTNLQIERIRKAFGYPEGYSDRKALKVAALDSRCLAEHYMIGSTVELVDSPWTPYALLAGKSLKWVNEDRMRRNLSVENGGTGGFAALGVFFGLPVGWVVFGNYCLVNLETRTVQNLDICRVWHQGTGEEMPESKVKNLRYLGKYSELLK